MVMRHICCSHCSIFQRLWRNLGSCDALTPTVTVICFSLLFHLLGLPSISEKDHCKWKKSFRFVFQHPYFLVVHFSYIPKGFYFFFYPKEFAVKFKLAHFQPENSTVVGREVLEVV